MATNKEQVPKEPLDRKDLHQCRRELTKEIDRLEFQSKRDAVEYNLKEQISLLYDEMDYVKFLLTQS